MTLHIIKCQSPFCYPYYDKISNRRIVCITKPYQNSKTISPSSEREASIADRPKYCLLLGPVELPSVKNLFVGNFTPEAQQTYGIQLTHLVSIIVPQVTGPATEIEPILPGRIRETLLIVSAVAVPFRWFPQQSLPPSRVFH